MINWNGLGTEPGVMEVKSLRVTFGDSVKVQKYHREGLKKLVGARLPDRLNFVRWGLIFVGSLYETCFLLPLFRLKFRGDFHNFSTIYAFLT